MFHTSIREAEVLGIHTVYTDHSLMDSNSMAGVAINEVLRCYSCCMNAFICVSRADRDNFCQRQRFASPPANLHVIPNAVDSDRFRRDYRLHPLVTRVRKAFCSASSITVVVLSRLVYRKGVCLLETVMNRTLASFPMVNFLVGGTGDEQERIQRLADRWNRQCGARRVLVMGEIAHEEVAPFLVTHFAWFSPRAVGTSTCPAPSPSPSTSPSSKPSCSVCSLASSPAPAASSSPRTSAACPSCCPRRRASS